MGRRHLGPRRVGRGAACLREQVEQVGEAHGEAVVGEGGAELAALQLVLGGEG